MNPACPLSPEGGSVCVGQSRALRILLIALSLAMILGLQGCAALTVMALTEVLEAANEAQRAKSESPSPTTELALEQASAQPNQGRTAVSMIANQVPREPRYRIRLDKDTIEAGKPVRLYSATSLESKTSLGLVVGVEEILLVFDPKGREIRRGSKKATAGRGEGQFTNTFELVLPRQAPAGSYRLVTEVYLGTEIVAREELKLTLTAAGGQRQAAQAR